MEKEVRVPTPDGEMKTFLVCPSEPGPFPVAILFMDAVGYREQIRANARRFAADGFFVAAPDLFYRAGDGIVVDMVKMMSAGPDSPERKRFTEVTSSLTPDAVERDTEAVLEFLKDDGAADTSRVVCVGYCMGTRIALHALATRPEVRAAAGIHPGALVTDRPDSPHHDLAGAHGELYLACAEHDHSATPESVEAFRQAMEAAGVQGTVERLPGTSHGFAMADLPVYDEAACERHFERTLDLWHRAVSA